MDKQKENARRDFIEMIRHSWTWNRMTEDEKRHCTDTFFSTASAEAIKGNYDTRYNICHAIYSAYLNGLGYDGGFWREPTATEPVPKF